MIAQLSASLELPGRQAGFSYLGLMIFVAILAMASSATLTLGSLAQRREAEEALLDVGGAYRRAIASYVNSSPQGNRTYPASLADLLKDPRYPGVRRHLRRLYPDPITGRNEWGLVLAPGGGIIGVHSLSTARPIKVAGFDAENQAFENRERYSEWVFAVVAPAARGGVSPQGAAPLPGGSPGANPARPGDGAAAMQPVASSLFGQPPSPFATQSPASPGSLFAPPGQASASLPAGTGLFGQGASAPIGFSSGGGQR